MIVEQVTLRNFRAAKDVQVEFDRKLNVLVGVNGAGKTTVLDALAVSLSWLVNRVSKPGVSGKSFKGSDISKGERKGHVDLSVAHGRGSYRWWLVGNIAKEEGDLTSACDGASKLAARLRGAYDEGSKRSSLPVVAYYPVDRNYASPHRTPHGRENGSSLGVYRDALDAKENYRSFLEWFIDEDDIRLESRSSQETWFKHNRKWARSELRMIRRSLARATDSKASQHAERQRPAIANLLARDEMWEEPRYFIYELLGQLHGLEEDAPVIIRGTRLFHDFEYLLMKLTVMFEYEKWSAGELVDSPAVEDILAELGQLSAKKEDREFTNFLWRTFSFIVQISLWWVSKKANRSIETLFDSARLWPGKGAILFASPESIVDSLHKILGHEVERRNRLVHPPGQGLRYVRKAIERFVPECSNVWVEGRPRPKLHVEKNGSVFLLEELSGGERNLIALVGDIARRLAVANPHRKNPLHGQGVVLIDEIDLHLHPKWQRMVIPRLAKTFPRCQFIVSTHSPQVISQVKPENVCLLEQTDKGIQCERPSETYGMTMNRVLELVMGDEARPENVAKELDGLFEDIERGKLSQAKKIVDSLKRDMPTDPAVLRAELLIRREESRR